MSSQSIIKVEGLSKKYILNKTATSKNDTLYGSFINGLRNIKKLTEKKETEEFWALKDVSFEINQGDRVGIIGRNGAGKSTLLKILSRITPPTSGKIEYAGRMASLLEVGTGFHGDLTGRENIYLNGSILGMTKYEIDRKFDEIVAFSEIESFLDTPVKRYSSGMYVRLAFAVAAHLESDILIVDEVLAVGDAAFQKKCLGKMNDISSNEGRTILFVSHNMGAVNSLCNKSIVLTKGNKVYDGNVQDGLNYYLKQNAGSFDQILRERTDRFGNGRFIFTDIKFKNKTGDIVQEVLSGEYLGIDLTFIADKTIDYSKLVINVAFMDDYQNQVLSFISDEMGISIKDENANIIRLEIPQLLMRGHQYTIRLFVSEGGTRQENICDRIEDAAQLNVLSSDFWNVGQVVRDGCYSICNGKYIIG